MCVCVCVCVCVCMNEQLLIPLLQLYESQEQCNLVVDEWLKSTLMALVSYLLLQIVCECF